MADRLSEKSIAQLFETVLQHAKCIEIRIDYARVTTSKKQKYVLTQALNKINSAINTICDLLPDSESILAVKKALDTVDMHNLSKPNKVCATFNMKVYLNKIH